jgi:carbonic anhydrase
MSNVGETFFTAVGCMDGRVQDPVAEFGRNKFGANFADTITEAGLVGMLAESVDPDLAKSLEFKIAAISAGKHNSKGVIVHGHQECAGNPVDDDTHKQNIKKASEFVKTLVPNLQVIPLFVVRGESGWEVEEL